MRFLRLEISGGSAVMQGKRVAIYGRVSTDGQTVNNQLQELHAVAGRHGWTIVETFTDHGVSGAKGRDQRPAFDRLLKGVARKDFEMVAAWSVDRLGRSLQHLVEFLGELKAKGVDLYLHQQGVDTSTAAGRALFQMLGVFAEFERAMIVERIRAGIARAKKHGTKTDKPFGRPRIDPKIEERIRRCLDKGTGMLKISKELGVGVSTVVRVKRQGAASPQPVS
jgi:DNA invertase Pin-like site-specific DNA recombinase